MIEIPGYKIHREIDSSDYCHSYSAIQLSSGKTMVVSIFSHSATQYISFKSFFESIESKLANKAFGVITPIKEFIKTQNHTYIISDLLSNSCQQVYKERATNTQTLFEQIYKIAISLNLYHHVDFYHGGVSLDNIFHDSGDSLTLGLPAFNQNFSSTENPPDFNLNRESYNAPEKEISQSKSRDYYALGVVLYELIFKIKPFIAESKDQLKQLQQAAVILIPNHEFDHLKPVFAALLNPNPLKRISSAAEFKHMTQNANISLSDIAYSIEPIQTNPAVKINTPSTDNSSIPKYTYYIASMVVLAVITVLFFTSSDKPNQLVNNESNDEQFITHNNANSSSINTNDAITEFNSLLNSATKSLDNQETASALMTINQALKIKPRNKKALDIKSQLELELKINAIIQQANQLILKGNIISPKNDNAIATYNKLQSILPKGDTRAKDGIKKISNAYHRLALKQYKLKNTELAKSILTEGLTALPNDKQLKKLISNIKSDEAKKLADIAFKRQKQKEKQAMQLQITQDNENNARIALIEQNKQRNLEVKKQEQLLKDFQIQKERQRQQQLTSLYNEAQRSLTDTQLTLNSIENAIDNLQSLEFLSVNSNKSHQLRQNIDTAYLSLSNYQVSVQQYPQAKETIRKGLITNPKNRNLTALQKQLNGLIAQQKTDAAKAQDIIDNKKEENALPIFGTF